MALKRKASRTSSATSAKRSKRAHSNATASSPDDSSAPSIDKLPTELIQDIAAYLLPELDRFGHNLISHNVNHANHDLMSLRLVSKRMEYETRPIFANHYFNKRSFLMASPSSMKTLQSISQHKAFSRSLTTIVFSPLILRERAAWLRLWSNHPNKDGRAFRAVRRDAMQGYKRAKLEETDFSFDEADAVMDSIFANLKNVGNKVGVRFVNEFDDFMHAYEIPRGYKTLLKSLGVDQVGTKCFRLCPDNRLHGRVYNAIQSSECSTTELGVGADGYPARFSTFLELKARSLSKDLRVFTLVGFADLDSRRFVRDVVECPVRREKVREFAVAISQMKNLEELYIALLDPEIPSSRIGSVDGNEDNMRRDLFHAIAKQRYLDGTPLEVTSDEGMMAPKLRKLDLSGVNVNFDTLLQFCRERRKTLEEMKLVSFNNPETWDGEVIRARTEEAFSTQQGWRLFGSYGSLQGYMKMLVLRRNR